jgi:hypothetical protein
MPGSLGIYLSVCGLQLRALGLLTLSSTPRPGSVLASTMGIRGGDGGKALTAQPPAGYLRVAPAATLHTGQPGACSLPPGMAAALSGRWTPMHWTQDSARVTSLADRVAHTANDRLRVSFRGLSTRINPLNTLSGDYSPVTPSMRSRSRSAWPRCRAYSLIRYR